MRKSDDFWIGAICWLFAALNVIQVVVGWSLFSRALGFFAAAMFVYIGYEIIKSEL